MTLPRTTESAELHQPSKDVPNGWGFIDDRPWLKFLSGAAFIFLMAFAAYFPAVHGEFVWDDDINLIGNIFVRSDDGLRQIWFSTEPLDYFPLTLSSFWIEWRLWGTNTFGYHV